GDKSDEFARLFQLQPFGEPGWLSIRGLRYEGALSALVVLYETRKLFGARTAERFLPGIALFELAFVRFLERDAREDAVRTLEDVTQRVHGEYELRLTDLERRFPTASRSTSRRRGASHPVSPKARVSRSAKASPGRSRQRASRCSSATSVRRRLIRCCATSISPRALSSAFHWSTTVTSWAC